MPVCSFILFVSTYMLPIMHLILNLSLKKIVLSEHGEKFTLEQCHTIKIKKSLKWRNLKNLGIKLALQLIKKTWCKYVEYKNIQSLIISAVYTE